MALPEPSTTYEVGIVIAADDEVEVTEDQIAGINAQLADHPGTFAVAEDPDLWTHEWEFTVRVTMMGNPAIALQRATSVAQNAIRIGSAGAIRSTMWVPIAANVAIVEAEPEPGE